MLAAQRICSARGAMCLVRPRVINLRLASSSGLRYFGINSSSDNNGKLDKEKEKNGDEGEGEHKEAKMPPMPKLEDILGDKFSAPQSKSADSFWSSISSRSSFNGSADASKAEAEPKIEDYELPGEVADKPKLEDEVVFEQAKAPEPEPVEIPASEPLSEPAAELPTEPLPESMEKPAEPESIAQSEIPSAASSIPVPPIQPNAEKPVQTKAVKTTRHQRAKPSAWWSRGLYYTFMLGTCGAVTGHFMISTLPDDETTTVQTRAYRRTIRNFMNQHFVVSAENYEAGRYHTFVTACFNHSGALHLGMNALGIVFISGIAFRLGMNARRVLSVGLLSGIVGNAVGLYVEDASHKKGQWILKNHPTVHHLGASGMIMGIMATTALMAPMLPVGLPLVPIAVPYASTVLGLVAWDGYNVWDNFGKPRGTGTQTGHAAHLGGVGSGVAYFVYRLIRRN